MPVNKLWAASLPHCELQANEPGSYQVNSLSGCELVACSRLVWDTNLIKMVEVKKSLPWDFLVNFNLFKKNYVNNKIHIFFVCPYFEKFVTIKKNYASCYSHIWVCLLLLLNFLQVHKEILREILMGNSLGKRIDKFLGKILTRDS